MKQLIKKTITNRYGYTLIEILATITIIGIIAIIIIPLFANNYTSIDTSGEKSSAIYESQQALEKVIAGQSLPDEVSVSQADQTIAITFSGTSYYVQGDLLEVEEDFGSSGRSTHIYYFQVK